LIWHVDDDGKAVLKFKTGASTDPRMLNAAQRNATRFVDQIVFDMGMSGISVTTDAVAVRRHTSTGMIEVGWTGTVKLSNVADAREYLLKLAKSQSGI